MLQDVTATTEKSNLATPDELAEILQISKKHLLELCRQGDIPHLRIGRRYRFDLEEVLSSAAADKKAS